MKIIAFALVVMFAGEQEQVASYWINQKHCLHDARMLSGRAEAYQPVKEIQKASDARLAHLIQIMLEQSK